MAKQDLGKIVPTFNGIYNANIVYEKLCIVNYKGSVYVSKQDIPKGTDISNKEYWYLLIEKLKKGVDYFTEEDRKAIIDEVTKLAESDFNKYYDEKKKALDKVASDNTAAFFKVVKDNTTDFNSNVDTQTKAFDTHYDEKVKSFDENSDKQTKAYDTNANKKLNDYNENHKTKMQELDDEATTKIAEYDQHSEELRKMAISTDNKLERVKNEVLDTGSVSDTFIHLEDSAMAELQKLEIEGVCQQKTTTGKNLFDENNLTRNLVLENGDITTNANWNMSNYIEVESDTVYTVKHNDTTSTSQSFILIEFDSDKKIIKRNVQGVRNSNIPYAITTTDITRYLIFNYNNTYNNSMLQIEKGGIPTNYEPYTGGQPSPSPDYPQEIKTITNNLKINSCGRNLLKNMATSTTVNGVSFTVNDDGSVLVNGTATADAVFKIVPIATTFSQNLILYPNKKYTLSDSAGDYINYFTQLVIKDVAGNKTWYNTSGAINISVNAIASLYTAQLYVRAGVTVNNVLFKPQLVVEDSTTNLFESYIETQIQANLPDEEFIGKINDTYKDTLRIEYFPKKGQYHLMLDKKIGKYIFTGNENWGTYTQSNGTPIYRCTLPIVKYLFVISNYFASQTTWTNVLQENRIFNHIGNYQNLEIACSKFNTLTNFKKFLTTNAVQMYYALTTPYILDLCVIDMPLSRNEVTNIITDSELMPNINAKYYRNFKKTVQNLQVNNKALKDELNDINNRLTALENAQTSTVSEKLSNESEANVNDIQE